MARRFALSAAFALACLLAPALAAHAQISCDSSQTPFQDADGNWFCAASEPNLSCYEDVAPSYDPDSATWTCPSIEDAKRLIARKEGPKVSCASEAVGEEAFWDEARGEWACPDAPTQCSLCQNRFTLCQADLGVAKDKCVARGRAVARTMCTGDTAVNWRGEAVDASDATCTESFVWDPNLGKKRKIKTCTGEAIDECIQGYMVSHPGETVASNIGGKAGVAVGAKGKAGVPLVAEGEVSVTGTLEMSAGRAWTSNWGGGVGIAAACTAAANQAASVCEPCNDTCSE